MVRVLVCRHMSRFCLGLTFWYYFLGVVILIGHLGRVKCENRSIMFRFIRELVQIKHHSHHYMMCSLNCLTLHMIHTFLSISIGHLGILGENPPCASLLVSVYYDSLQIRRFLCVPIRVHIYQRCPCFCETRLRSMISKGQNCWI